MKNSYTMTVDLNVLDHLADGLYSSVSAVLTEAVANAWDADAQEVHIFVDIEGDKISIQDDGIGMNHDAINDHYLRVGYKRRENGSEETSEGRLVMGRKGIGKLSLMSIADIIEVRSMMENQPPVGLRISISDLRNAMKNKETEYHPEPVPVDEKDFTNYKTRIVITKLKKERLRDVKAQSLIRRLARRFSIIGSDEFRVFINGHKVISEDREDLKFVEYVWTFGDDKIDSHFCSRPVKDGLFKEAGRLESWDKNWRVKGWIGTVGKPKSLSTPEGNLNSIVVLSRGRLVQEDILPRISNAEIYTKYITGQVEADFLDESDQEDIVTSNRQSLVEDNKRVLQLIVFLKKAMRNISHEWNERRAKDKTSDLQGRYSGISEWLDTLEVGWRKKARLLLERIATMELTHDNAGSEEARKTLLRHAVLGFERLRLRGNAEELTAVLGQDMGALLKLLADRDDLEASLYKDIVKNRLDVIQEFEKLTDGDQKERVLQKYLFDHLWLLDPAWERATGTEAMEKKLKLREPFLDNDETKEEYGRVDIRYRTIAGEHVIIELKRASVSINIHELIKQGAKYVDALRDLLSLDAHSFPPIEVIFIVGKKPEDIPGRVESFMNGVSPGAGSRMETYDNLIDRARQGYSEYLEKSKQMNKIEQILESLE